MLPGPNVIIACPHCGHFAKKRTLNSFNTFGVQIWSDAKQIAPMKPEFPSLVLCKKCQQFYRVKDAKKIEEISNTLESINKWKEAEFIEFPSFKQYLQALERLPEEKFLRILTWHCFNDFFRNDKENEITQEMQEGNSKNLKALLMLITENDNNDLLMKIEILRNLGLFEESLKLLNKITDVNLAAVKEKFEIEIHKKNKKVFRLF